MNGTTEFWKTILSNRAASMAMICLLEPKCAMSAFACSMQPWAQQGSYSAPQLRHNGCLGSQYVFVQ